MIIKNNKFTRKQALKIELGYVWFLRVSSLQNQH